MKKATTLVNLVCKNRWKWRVRFLVIKIALEVFWL